MIRIIEKVVDYYLSRSVKNQVILLLMGGGLYLIVQSVLGLVFEEWLKLEYGIEIPNVIYLGLILVTISLVIIYHDIKYSFLPSLFNTVKTSRCIYLGDKTYQFVFDKRMRCSPTICMLKPSPIENGLTVKKIDKNGFIVVFEQGKELSEIQFWADAWEGLNLRQRLYIKAINVFRSRENKIEKRVYENAYSQRKIDAINGA